MFPDVCWNVIFSYFSVIGGWLGGWLDYLSIYSNQLSLKQHLWVDIYQLCCLKTSYYSLLRPKYIFDFSKNSKNFEILKIFKKSKSWTFWSTEGVWPVQYLCLNLQGLYDITFLENLKSILRFSFWRQTCEKSAQLKSHLLKRLAVA